MRLETLRYFWREASISLARNRVLSIATATTIAVCVFILGVALLLYINTGLLVEHLESDVEIVAFLEKDLSSYQVGELRQKLGEIKGVKKVTFVSKDEALEKLTKKLGQGEYDLKETLGGENPLPDSFRIKASSPKEVEKLAQALAKMEGISRVRYGKEIVNKLFRITRWVRYISLFSVLVLALAAVFLVATTIRLTIYSRQKEMYIMKLVGATDWFIRMPFFIEGMLLALAGTLVAVGALSFGYYYLLKSMKAAMAFIPLVEERQVLAQIYLGLLVAGTALGAFGTTLAVNKYLDV